MSLPLEAVDEIRKKVNDYVGNQNSIPDLVKASGVNDTTLRRIVKHETKTVSYENAIRILNVVCPLQERVAFSEKYLKDFVTFFSSQNKPVHDPRAIDSRTLMKPLHNLIWTIVANERGSTLQLLEKKFGSEARQAVEELEEEKLVWIEKNGRVHGKLDWSYKKDEDRIEQVSLFAKNVRRENFGESSILGFNSFEGCSKKIELAMTATRKYMKEMNRIRDLDNTEPPQNVGMFGVVFSCVDDC